MGEEDEEITKIKRKKLREMMGSSIQEERKSILSMPIEVTDATFMKVIHDYPAVVIDCWAPWCAPCRMVAPIVEQLARDYSGRILFGKLNVDENQTVAASYHIMSIPTFLVFKNGELVDRIVEAMPREMLEPRIVRSLQEKPSA